MLEDATSPASQSVNPGEKKFTIVLMTIYSVENAGIRYISAALQRAGFETHIVFLRDWVHNRLEMPSETDIRMAMDIVREKGADLIGIGFMSSLYSMALKVTDDLAAEFPDIPILWGGIHPTSVPEECIPHCDYVGVGEGERAVIDLCGALRDEAEAPAFPTIWAKIDGEVFGNNPRPLLTALDWLPYPDTADDNKYYIEKGRLTIEEPWKRSAEYRIYFSRGCPYNCSYCYVSILRDVYEEKGKKFYRARSVEHILGELEHMQKTFPKVARIKIDDDTSFAFGEDWMEEFLDKYPKRVGKPFECLLIPPMMRPDMLTKLVAAGLVRVQTGIESGSSKESKEIHNRSPGNRSIMKFAEFNKQLKLNLVYDVIVDNPMAPQEMKIETAEFLLDLPRPYDIFFYSLNFFPGTALTRQALADGSLDPNEVEGRANKAWYQFRVSMDWPRSEEDRFYLAVFCLASKSFVPKALIRKILDEREHWKKNVEPVYMLAQATNMVKMAYVAARYFKNGELTWFKIRQYGDLTQMISQ
ncbi:MAG: B12-binding domain-containing radical SAM protein [Deltaproteobacteria bacterium]|nr:B12-binding domain-containing radical SAM protein [Deltaproteobacteria bacterium]